MTEEPLGLGRLHHPRFAALPADGSDRRADLQLVDAVRAAGRSEPTHRGDHQPAAAVAWRRPADPACQSDYDHDHQHARQGRPCSPNAGRGRDLLPVAPADSGAVERPPAMVPNPQPSPGQIPQGPSARTAPDPFARLIPPAKREPTSPSLSMFAGQPPDLGSSRSMAVLLFST